MYGHACPNCGYCPACGRSDRYVRPTRPFVSPRPIGWPPVPDRPFPLIGDPIGGPYVGGRSPYIATFAGPTNSISSAYPSL